MIVGCGVYLSKILKIQIYDSQKCKTAEFVISSCSHFMILSFDVGFDEIKVGHVFPLLESMLKQKEHNK